jgi:flagellar biosynthesis protein FliQ
MVNYKAGLSVLLFMFIMVFVEVIFIPMLIARITSLQNTTGIVGTTAEDTLDSVPEILVGIVILTVLGGFIGAALIAVKT